MLADVRPCRISRTVVTRHRVAGARCGRAVLRRSPGFAVAGAALFVLLFWVYASSLQYAELALVTLGWVVALQVGVVLLDRFKYGVDLPTDKWVAVLVVLAAQAYLLLAPTGAAPEEAEAAPAPAAVVVALPDAEPAAPGAQAPSPGR